MPFACGRVIPRQEFRYVKMFLKEVYDCEVLITVIERSPALYDCSLKEYSDKSLKEKLWGEVCEAVEVEWSQLDGAEKREKGKQCWFQYF